MDRAPARSRTAATTSLLRFLGITSGRRGLLPWWVFAGIGWLSAAVCVLTVVAGTGRGATVVLAIASVTMLVLALAARRSAAAGRSGSS